MKKVYGNLYFAKEALSELEPALKAIYNEAIKICNLIPNHNIIKIHKNSQYISLQHYPNLEITPHPSLHKSIKINLVTKELKCVEYLTNRFILHRLEHFLAIDNPRIKELSRITEKEQMLGLYEKSVIRKIGRQNYWNMLCLKNGIPESISND